MWDLNSSSACLSVSFERVVAKANFETNKERNKRKMAWKGSEKSSLILIAVCFIWEEENSCFREMLR